MKRSIVVFGVLVAFLCATFGAYAVENATWGRIKANFAESPRGYRTEELDFAPLHQFHTGNGARVAKGWGQCDKGKGTPSWQITEAEELITVKKGGRLRLYYEVPDYTCVVEMELRIPRRALEEDSMLRMCLANASAFMTDVEAVFGQHGTQFLIPAELIIEVEGLNLSSMGDVGFYYYDEEKGLWYELTIVEFDVGPGDWTYVKLLLEHFSRYALGQARR